MYTQLLANLAILVLAGFVGFAVPPWLPAFAGGGGPTIGHPVSGSNCIVLIGPHSAGKSTLGRRLAEALGCPFDDELGERIYNEVSAQAWQMWLEHSKMLINEYRLDLVTPEAFQLLHDRCDAYLFGEGSAPPPEFKPSAQK